MLGLSASSVSERLLTGSNTIAQACVTFNGTNNTIDTGLVTDCDTFDVSIRFLHPGSASSDFLLDSRGVAVDGVLIWFDATANLNARARINGTDYTINAGTGYDDAAWHLAQITYDGANFRFYVDGSQIGSGTAATGSVASTNDLHIGSSNVPNNYFVGRLCDFSMTLDGELALKLPLCEGSGATVYDASGKLRDQTISGTTTNTWDNTQNVVAHGFTTSSGVNIPRGAVNGCVLFVTAPAQSNGRGRGATNSTPAATLGEAYQINGGTLTQLADPVGTGDNQANVGSAWPRFGSTYYSTASEVAVVLPQSAGGSAMSIEANDGFGHWDDGGTLYSGLTSEIDSAITGLANRGIAIRKMVFLMVIGETDSKKINSGATGANNYKSAFLNFKAKLEVLYGADYGIDGGVLEFLIVETGRNTNETTAGFDAIREVQAELVEEYAEISWGWRGAPTADLVDNVHYTTAELETMGAALATAAASL